MTFLSVIMPNYNYGHFIGTALDSILLTNSSANFELIVIDDASTDQSKEVLKKYALDPRVKIYYNRINMGAAKTIHKGIEKSNGSYLHFFASDDFHLPGTIDFMIAIMKKAPNIPLFCSRYLYFNSFDKLQTASLIPNHEDFFLIPPQTIKKLFSHSDFWIPGHTVFMSQQIYHQYGPFDEKMGPLCDWILNHQIALNHGIGYIKHDLMATRQHGASLSATLSLVNRREIWMRLLHRCRTDPSLKALSKTGLFRMLGLKAIYKRLLANPRYWKYAIPIIRRQIAIGLFKFIGLKIEDFLLKKINKKATC